MIDYGLVGRERTVLGRHLLAVWNSLPVTFKVTINHSVSYSIPQIAPKIGSIPLRELFIANVDNSLNHAKITEVVSKLGLPQKIEVALYDRTTRKCIAIKYSEDNGVIVFNNLDTTRLYTLVALDPENVYNASIQDLVHPRI